MTEYPDPSEKRVRFGCGFLFGSVFGFLVVVREVALFTGPFWLCVGGVAVLFGILAVRYGDDFWRGLPNWMRWW